MVIGKPTRLSEPNEIPGSTPGAKTFEEYKNDILRGLVLFGDSLSSRMKKASAYMDFNTSSTESREEEPKYAVDTDGNSYLAGGTLFMNRLKGGMAVSQEGTAAKHPVFSVFSRDKLYSSPAGTVLGSVDIKTTAGDVMNPLMTELPSSHMSPLTLWTKHLFPVFSTNDIIIISILEGITAALLLGVEQLNDPTEPSQTKVIRQNIDMGTIIQDNSKLETKILNRQLRNNS